MKAAGRIDVTDAGYDKRGSIWHNPGGEEGVERGREVEVCGENSRGVPEHENDCNHDGGTLMDARVWDNWPM